MIKQNIKLSQITNYKIGGNARFVLFAQSKQELIKGLQEWFKIAKDKKLDPRKIFILGEGTNVLADDSGFDGLIVKYEGQNIEEMPDNQISVAAGLSVKNFNRFLIDHTLSGFEWSGGLPGTVGGAIFGNAGAFGGETKDNIVTVESLEIETQEIKIRNRIECQFAYRTSIFKKELAQKEIILSAIFQFQRGEKTNIKNSVQEKINYRIDRQPLDFPSAGSTFKNVPLAEVPETWRQKFAQKQKNDPFPIIPAAVFIAEAQLMGLSIGRAKISEKHPNFIINSGHATSQDVESLIKLVIEKVKEEFNVTLTPEIIKIKN